jgi:hypothetical protein
MRAQVAANIGGDSFHISKHYIDQWLNDGYKNLAHRVASIEQSLTLTGISTGETTFSTTSTDPTYPLLNRAHQIRRVEMTSGSTVAKLDYISLDELDRFKGNSGISTGTPWAYYLWGNTIGLYPAPAGSVDLNIKYVEDSPSALPNSGEITTIPAFMQPLLVHYATSQGYLKLQNVSQYREFKAMYDIGLETARMELDMDNRDMPGQVHDIMGYGDDDLWNS